MDRLGFFMDTEGNVTWFGKWVKKRNLNDELQFHDSSFTKEVEENKVFQSLNLIYKKGAGLYEKTVPFALQGMITLTNWSVEYNNELMIMWVPVILTSAQKEKLSALYEILSSFESVCINICSKEFVEEQDKVKDVDEYYERFSIEKGKIQKEQEGKTI